MKKFLTLVAFSLLVTSCGRDLSQELKKTAKTRGAQERLNSSQDGTSSIFKDIE